jgi:hypothetical protein
MRYLYIACAFFLFSFKAQSATFTAVVTGAWNNPATWGALTYPGTNDNVIIPGGITVTVTLNNTALCTDLTINLGGKLTANWALQIKGNIVNSGTINGSNNVYLFGFGKTISSTGSFTVGGSFWINGTRTINSRDHCY